MAVDVGNAVTEVPQVRGKSVVGRSSVGVDLQERPSHDKFPMKIYNKTKYSTENLRRLFRACFRHLGVNSTRYIYVYYSKTENVEGEGNLGDEHQGRVIRIWIPWKKFLSKKQLARVFEHEVLHNIGVDHPDMDPKVRACEQPVSWAWGIEV